MKELVQSVVDQRSPLGTKRLTELLDQIPQSERRTRDQHDLNAYGYWSLLSIIGTEACAAKLLDERMHFGTCMARSPGSVLGHIGTIARGPAIQVLRDWKNLDGEALLLAMSVLGPNALKHESQLLKEIVAGETKRIRILQKSFRHAKEELSTLERAISDATRTENENDDGSYPAKALRFSRLSGQYRQHLQFLTEVLSMFREDEREFVLASLLEFSSEPRILSQLIPNAFQGADAPWVADQLWEYSRSHSDGSNVGKAIALGFSRERIGSKRWVQSIDFPITSDSDLILFERIGRPDLRPQLERRAREYKAKRKPPVSEVYYGK